MRVSSDPKMKTYYYIVILGKLLLDIGYSPWTFNKAKPNERPNKVTKKHVATGVTISAS